MFKNKFYYYFFFIFLFSCTTPVLLFAQTEQTVKTRPSVAVVLAGGGARGFVHIPVLEMLEEEGIPIDIIIGNSAGSIIGGLYCAGYTPKEILQYTTNFNWSSVFQDKVTSPFEKTLESHSISTTPFSLRLKNSDKNISIQMGNSLLTGQGAYELLKTLTMRIPSNIDFDTLPIPFRAITVDLLTGALIVLSEGDLAEAMRASMSIPGLFQPFLLNDLYCVDGMARNNNPIDIASQMGYDIIIDVDFGNTLENSYESFNSTPLVAVNQMMNMEQNIKNLENYALADIVILPDYGEYSLIDYDKASEIYKTAKADIERYRPQIKEIKKKIDNWQKNNTQTKNTKTSVYRNKEPAFPDNYFDNPLPEPNEIIVNTSIESTEKYAKKFFNKLKTKDMELSEEELKSLSEGIYNTGKYDSVTTQNQKTEENEKLVINTIEKNSENNIILFGADYEGTLTSTLSSKLVLTSDIQFRDLTGKSSVLSLKGTFFDDIGAEFMYRQPISAHLFLQLDSYFKYDCSLTQTPWSSNLLSSTKYTRKAETSALFGIPFSTTQTFLGGANINWVDTTHEIANGDESFNTNFFINYTSNFLDHTLFSAEGVYVALKNNFVFPITENSETPFFGITTIDMTTAIPINNKLTFLCNTFLGTNIDQRLTERKDLYPIYGFSISDRRFLPQLTDRTDYGIHKGAIEIALQFAPWNQITLLGGKAFFGISAATGDTWASFDTITLSELEWRSSLDTGLRITDSFGLLLRVGAGTEDNEITPFLSFDLGNIRY